MSIPSCHHSWVFPYFVVKIIARKILLSGRCTIFLTRGCEVLMLPHSIKLYKLFRFWVKSMSKEEVLLVHNTMPMYYHYIKETAALTFLPQHLAMYRTTVNKCKRYFIILRNVFSPINKLDKKFDLKGSTVGRDATESEKAKESPTLKDNENMKLKIGKEVKAVLMEKMERDVEFLSSLNLMDYSLLVGIHIPTIEMPIAVQSLDSNGCSSDNEKGTEGNTRVNKHTEDTLNIASMEPKTNNWDWFALQGIAD